MNERAHVRELQHTPERRGVDFRLEEIPQELWPVWREWLGVGEWTRLEDLFRFRTLASMSGQSVESPQRGGEWIRQELRTATTTYGDIEGYQTQLHYLEDLALAITLDPTVRDSEYMGYVPYHRVAAALQDRVPAHLQDAAKSMEGRASFGPANIPDWYSAARVAFPDSPDLWTLSLEHQAALREIAERVKGGPPWQCQDLFLGMRNLGLLPRVTDYLNLDTFAEERRQLLDVHGDEADLRSKLDAAWFLTLASADSVVIGRDGQYDIHLPERVETSVVLPPRDAA